VAKQCVFCGRFFTPDRRVGARQKACGREECRRQRRQAAQRDWCERNPGYFSGRYEYVKSWRQKRRDAVIQDEIPPATPVRRYVLLIPGTTAGMIQDEIILRRVDRTTFSAYG
jgi:hypothetical protein